MRARRLGQVWAEHSFECWDIVFLFPFPALLLTLGLFYLVINALILWMLDLFIPLFWVGGFWAAFKGALSFSVLNWLMSWLLNDE